MNLIVNRHLDRSEEQAIYELTLKKQRSKKSTISRRQAEAMQQLASELVPQRKHLDELLDVAALGPLAGGRHWLSAADLCRCSSQLTQAQRQTRTQSQSQSQSRATSTAAAATTNSSQPDEVGARDQNNNNNNNNGDQSGELQRQSSTSTIATSATSASTAQHSLSTASAGSMPDGACIKLNQLRLEHLNNELKRRLNQYEYLVAQEKALLGACNRSLIASEGVNNFHLYRLGHKF